MKPFPLPKKDIRMKELIETTDQKLLAIWAIECLERFMPLIDNKYSDEERPRTAINVLKKWINNEITMWKQENIALKYLHLQRK